MNREYLEEMLSQLNEDIRNAETVVSDCIRRRNEFVEQRGLEILGLKVGDIVVGDPDGGRRQFRYIVQRAFYDSARGVRPFALIIKADGEVGKKVLPEWHAWKKENGGTQ